MRRRDLILGGAAALLACATPTLALTPAQQLVLFSAKKPYTGPGDIVSGWTAWYGLRAYNAAVCGTGAQKAVNVRRNTDNATQDILILPSTCGVDIASATTFAGTYSATGTIASTVWTVTAVSGTPITVGDTISGTGVTAGSTVVSKGTGTGGTGTYNLNVASTVSVGEPMNATHGLFIATAYDQSGNGHDVAQATAANQPQLLLSGGSSASLPTGTYSGSQLLASGTISSLPQPYSFSSVQRRTTTAARTTISTFASGAQGALNSTAVADTVNLFAGANLTATAVNSVYHAIQAVANGVSSVVSVDGTDATGTAGTGASGTSIGVGGNPGSSSLWIGQITEAGLIANGLSAGQRSAITANQRAFWGF